MLDRTELETIAKLIDSLNHYQILKISQLASEVEIREAFHREALEFHPDQYFSENDSELHALSKKIYSRIVEAYQTLSKRERRVAYDKSVFGASSPSFEDEEDDVDEDAITSIRRKPTWASQGPGDKFFQLAQKAYNNRDYHTAQMNIQIAIGTDASNPRFKGLKERIDAEIQRLKDAKKKDPWTEKGN